MQIPILTDRQFQVLSLLYEGATRTQIAEMLNLSPETIKCHTKAVLSHFGVTSMRDGFDQIQYYMNHFGDPTQDAAVRYSLVHTKQEVHPEPNSNFLQRCVSGQVVRGTMSTFRHYIRSRLPPTDYIINGGPPSNVTTAGEHRTFEHAFDRPLAAGDKFDMKIELNVRGSGVPESQHYSESIKRPTETLIIEMIFPNGTPASTTFNKVENRGVEPIEENTELTDTTARVVVTSPKIGGLYTIAWCET